MPAPAYPHRLAGHCGSGSLRDLLELHGLDYGRGPLSEGACFGFGGGLGFFFREEPSLYVVGRMGELEQDVVEILGAGLEIAETDDPATAWRTVRAEIDAGRPPMVWADIAELEYLRVRMSNTRHDVVVAGYDEAEGIAWIADNDRQELQRCSLASLARARSSSAFPGPNHHRAYLYTWPEELRPAAEAVPLALRRAVGNMRGEREQLFGLTGATGLAGVEAFAAAYPTWSGDLDATLGLLRVLIVKAGTGGAMFRSLHAEFLHDAASLLDDAELHWLGGLYDALAATWVALAEHAGAREHAAGLPLVERIATLEAEGLVETERWLDGTA